MKKFLIIILLLIFPLPVNAGIICNDGWESSCEVSGPGCCSHHGGVDKGTNYEGANYNSYSSNNDSFFDRLENGEYAGELTLLILGSPIILSMIFEERDRRRQLEKIKNKSDKKK